MIHYSTLYKCHPKQIKWYTNILWYGKEINMVYINFYPLWLKLKKKKVLVLKFQLSRNFTLEYISFWQRWLIHIYLEIFEPHKSLSSYFERKNVFSTLFPNCGNYHRAGSSRGERHLFEVPIYLHQPYGGDTETVS